MANIRFIVEPSFITPLFSKFTKSMTIFPDRRFPFTNRSKPSNVLVALEDDLPAPEVIDFGVAKATQQRSKLSQSDLGARE